jgi:hypothetical protein
MNKSLKFILIIICIVVVGINSVNAAYIPHTTSTIYDNKYDVNLSELPNSNVYYIIDKYRCNEIYGSKIVVYNPQTQDIREFVVSSISYYKIVVGKTYGHIDPNAWIMPFEREFVIENY